MNGEIQHIRNILQFCEDGHDIDGTWPHPFMLRSFAINGNVEESRMEEHRRRIKYYRDRLENLLQEQRAHEHVNKKQKTF